MRTTNRYIFATIRIEGAILPPDLLQRIADGDASVEGLSPDAYHLATGEKINEAINRAWNRALGAWETFKTASAKLPEGDPGTTITRTWLLLLFAELGYGRLATAKAIEIAGDAYPISHGWQNTPIHLVGFRVDLDTRTVGVAGAARTSPHSLVQIALNRSDTLLWGFASNGLRLRILRDNKMLTRQAFVEFDLQAMMDGQVYSDFALLWLVCHQSRVEAERPEECWLEKWSRAAAEQGTRALDQLRGGVEEAISALGRGFIAHPANRNLRDKLYAGKLDAQDYYRQLLRLVYRLIFLFVSEDRGLLLTPNTDTTTCDIYSRFYSITKLRALAERRRGTRHADLYHGLRLVMQNLGSDMGCPELGLPALGGFLFSPTATADLAQCDIANHDLLDAIRALAFTMDRNTRRVVDYKNLGSEELGSVYESLLELHPIINSDAGVFELKTASGNERKTTGSFYTPTPLINCLLDSALDPILDEAIRKHVLSGANGSNPEQAIRAPTGCASAGGSGHIAIAAARRIAKRLATIRTGDEEPSPEAMRTALRDVITHCIYVVDVNPMAIELCKVNLWMEMQDPRYPLSFLDAHIKCGNSLIGVAPGMDIDEIPDEAFNPVTGDHRPTANTLKKRNKPERAGQASMELRESREAYDTLPKAAERMRELNAMPEETAAQVHAKGEAYQEFLESEEYARKKLEYNLWTAAFFWQIKEDAHGAAITAPTQGELARLRRGEKLNLDLVRGVQALAERLRFFHWELEFPEVFEQGGFNANLSNPPWERIKLQEEEFFAARDPAIATAPNKAARQKLIDALPKKNAALAREFEDAKHDAEATSKFVRESKRFPLTAIGDVNTYALFAEHARTMLNANGRAGIILPTGIATDDTTKAFFGDLIAEHSLASLFDFENREAIFPGVHRSYKFSLLTMSSNPIWRSEFSFFSTRVEHLRDDRRRFSIATDEIALFNPNTHTMSIFRTRADFELTRKIYQRVPVLVNEQKNASPWNAFYMRLVDLSDHAEYVRFPWEEKGTDWDVPLYEAKLYWTFDHRLSTFDEVDQSQCIAGQPRELSTEEKQNPNKIVGPRYFVPRKLVKDLFDKYPNYQKPWLLVWRDVTNSTNERTCVATAIPRVAATRKCPALGNSAECSSTMLLANLNSLVLDYVARQKIGGMSLAFFILKQLPVLPPSAYTPADIDFIAPRVLELVYTAWDLKPFAEDMGYHGEPFRWDDERRAHLRAELDAYYARLYGLTRDELRYILDPKDVYGEDFPGETFRVLKEKEIKQYGEYRTRRLVLEKWDEQEARRNVVEILTQSVRTTADSRIDSGDTNREPRITWIPESPVISPVEIIPLTPNHRQAVVVAWILQKFGTGQSIPLFDAQKYCYFLQRASLADAAIEFREFARGPYAPQVTYRAGTYADKRSYWQVKGKNVIRKRNINEAVNSVNRVIVDLDQAQHLVEKLAAMSRDDLGGLATVDFASRALFERGEEISPQNIHAYFKSDWQEKVNDRWYTEANIHSALEWLSAAGLFKKQ
ncbi:MAG: hypothetical protein M1282_04160 [Chloroflexi bacterium]|nr:hypothetical protein [Chloroflexota bacterium]